MTDKEWKDLQAFSLPGETFSSDNPADVAVLTARKMNADRQAANEAAEAKAAKK